ncbi:unnamed protein product [Neospora caninum Liverpool]|uniref:Toxoplasma gondii family A protein n=1 Tax=Neospora caninum (strain Liverpool) TaxID=572307 RepID=F0VRI8_NEOCL|nr:uncharacterized protein NCLIV_067610 [Neospora caninum Liverpool]CBZ56336.1 unnamed protein product [Neospora caninum Liverpool]CEL71096.1 TPA: hypothetical protein BN1204_067610 [Neospora caninum Liverpool]|eukprot:XP_003886361.1 uncharacterized protein NCLIV_067610 [Neospora caninum Liverpool]
MERQLFRAVCLTLLLGTVLSCVASETSEQKPAANFTTTIPKEGLERDVEQVFYLGPSSTLQVIDETGKAKYLPEPSTTSDDALSEQYSVAYRFENGTCDFTQTLVFNDAFPGYTKPLWAPDKSGSAETEGAPSGGRVRYTFTTPPEEYLGGGLSFCVRFKTVLASGSESQTSTSTTPTSATSNQGEPQEKPPEGGPESPPESPPTSQGGGPVPGDQVPGEQQQEAGSEEGEKVEVEIPLLSEDGTDPLSETNSKVSSSGQDSHVEIQNVADSLNSAADAPAANQPEKGGNNLSSGAIGEPRGARLRRLSGSAEVNDAFLTIVVHSKAWGFADGMIASSIFSLAVAATLLATS